MSEAPIPQLTREMFGDTYWVSDDKTWLTNGHWMVRISALVEAPIFRAGEKAFRAYLHGISFGGWLRDADANAVALRVTKEEPRPWRLTDYRLVMGPRKSPLALVFTDDAGAVASLQETYLRGLGFTPECPFPLYSDSPQGVFVDARIPADRKRIIMSVQIRERRDLSLGSALLAAAEVSNA